MWAKCIDKVGGSQEWGLASPIVPSVPVDGVVACLGAEEGEDRVENEEEDEAADEDEDDADVDDATPGEGALVALEAAFLVWVMEEVIFIGRLELVKGGLVGIRDEPAGFWGHGGYFEFAAGAGETMESFEEERTASRDSGIGGRSMDVWGEGAGDGSSVMR